MRREWQRYLGHLLKQPIPPGDKALLDADCPRTRGWLSAVPGARALDEIGHEAKLILDIALSGPEPLKALAEMLATRGGGRSEVIVHAPVDAARTATIILGRAFRLDSDLADAVKALHGVENVKLKDAQPARFAATG